MRRSKTEFEHVSFAKITTSYQDQRRDEGISDTFEQNTVLVIRGFSKPGLPLSLQDDYKQILIAPDAGLTRTDIEAYVAMVQCSEAERHGISLHPKLVDGVPVGQNPAGFGFSKKELDCNPAKVIEQICTNFAESHVLADDATSVFKYNFEAMATALLNDRTITTSRNPH